MPRLPRVYLKDAVYYITCLAGYNESLFKDSVDYNQYLELLHKYEQEHNFKLFAFVLLPKEIRLLIEDKNEVTISTIMHNLNSTYTKLFNSRYNRKGHLFQSRFKSILIEKKELLPRFVRFIHALPLKLGLTSDLGSFPYCGHYYYLHPQEGRYPQMKEAIQEVLTYFPLEGSFPALDEYVKGAEPKEFENIQKFIHRKHFVGSPEFMEKIQEMLKEEEEEAKPVPQTNRIREEIGVSLRLRRLHPAFVFSGSLIILFLSVLVTLQYLPINIWKPHMRLTKLREMVEVVTITPQEDIAQAHKDRDLKRPTIEVTFEDSNKSTIKSSLIKQDEEIPVAQGALNGSVWQITIMPVGDEQVVVWEDELVFQDGKVVSSKLIEQGYFPSETTFTRKEDGSIAWQTAYFKDDGSKASWYGVWRGQTMRGVLSEHSPEGGPVRNYTFVSIKKLGNG